MLQDEMLYGVTDECSRMHAIESRAVVWTNVKNFFHACTRSRMMNCSGATIIITLVDRQKGRDHFHDHSCRRPRIHSSAF